MDHVLHVHTAQQNVIYIARWSDYITKDMPYENVRLENLALYVDYSGVTTEYSPHYRAGKG